MVLCFATPTLYKTCLANNNISGSHSCPIREHCVIATNCNYSGPGLSPPWGSPLPRLPVGKLPCPIVPISGLLSMPLGAHLAPRPFGPVAAGPRTPCEHLRSLCTVREFLSVFLVGGFPWFPGRKPPNRRVSGNVCRSCGEGRAGYWDN